MTVTKKGPAPTKTEQKQPDLKLTREEQTYLDYFHRWQKLNSLERFNEVFEEIGDDMCDPQFHIDALTNLYLDCAPRAEHCANPEDFNASTQSLRSVINWLRILRNNQNEKQKCLRVLDQLKKSVRKDIQKRH